MINRTVSTLALCQNNMVHSGPCQLQGALESTHALPKGGDALKTATTRLRSGKVIHTGLRRRRMGMSSLDS